MTGNDGAGDGRATRWAGQRAKRRAEIVAAALDAIKAHGPGVSTEQIAAGAGIARTRLYRHFDDADDLYDAVAQGAAQAIIERMVLTFASPRGSAQDLITKSVRTYVAWLIENHALYQYVVLRTVDAVSGRDPLIVDVRAAISAPMRSLLAGYLGVFGQDPAIADPIAFGITGLVESATNRWLAHPGPLDLDALVGNLSGWVWGVLDAALRNLGIQMDPTAPLPEVAGESPA
ncbi:TetR/AcrR family transcriptional regulator [Labedaea rhizosphaerae]|uniref:TetR family transcriptional regulator n=1 Tax=Labedaea rhizosphaerae TaxID=598644 RepID=A0A4R6SCZ1_LABRH|nr:TetR/AcrR family transcriptional regulator [Labedaea rhizosphaerae]TDP97800.1 TetR family transcriptional regulator [Labedaea rhizosphaerae]